MPCHDPYYEDVLGPAGWVRQQVERLGVKVEVDRTLMSPGYASRDGHVIVARPGLPFPTFHWLLASGLIASLFGIEAAPDLPLAPAVGGANVLPFQRGPAYALWGNLSR